MSSNNIPRENKNKYMRTLLWRKKNIYRSKKIHKEFFIEKYLIKWNIFGRTKMDYTCTYMFFSLLNEAKYIFFYF